MKRYKVQFFNIENFAKVYVETWAENETKALETSYKSLNTEVLEYTRTEIVGHDRP